MRKDFGFDFFAKRRIARVARQSMPPPTIVRLKGMNGFRVTSMIRRLSRLRRRRLMTARSFLQY
jgi:hypothetical protein